MWQPTSPSLPSTLFSTSTNGGSGMTSSELPSNVPKTHYSQTLLPTTTLASHWCWHTTPQIMVSGPSCRTLLTVVKKGPLHTCNMFLILLDAYSKWFDVHLMQSISSANTIEKPATHFVALSSHLTVCTALSARPLLEGW